MTEYDPVAYWTDRGKRFEAEAIAKGWDHTPTPEVIRLLGSLSFGSILDVGCGFGRMAQAITERFPDIEYTGVDVSTDMIVAARRRVPTGEFIVADLATFETDRTWDVVLSLSTLGHIRPEDLPRVMGRLRRMARRDLIVVEWDDVGASTAYQYGHDFRAFLPGAVEEQIGRLTMFQVQP